MDIRLLTDKDYVSYMKSFMRAAETAFGIGGTERAAYRAQGINDVLLAEMYPLNFEDIDRALMSHVRAYVPRSNRLDRVLHRRQMLRFQQSIWRLSHFFPPGWTKIGHRYGYESAEQTARMTLNLHMEEQFNVNYLDEFNAQRLGRDKPPREWLSAGTVLQFTEFFEMAWMLSRYPDLFVGMEVNHPMEGNLTYEWTLSEFITAAGAVFKTN